MSVAPATSSSILVVITGVTQAPSVYSVVGTTLTFSTAPPVGTASIIVRYLGIPESGVTTTAYRTLTEFTATASQTTFTPPSYTVGFIAVYQNGVMLGSTDYTATNGTTVVLAVGALVSDLVTTESFYVSSVLNALPVTGGTISGNLVVTGTETVGTIISPTALTLQTNNGTTAITVDTSQNVGIGTASPGEKLDVSGNIRLSGSDTYIKFINAGGYDFTIRGNNGNSLDFISPEFSATPIASMTNAGVFQFNSGYGSSANAYGCRAWVNFNGTVVTPSTIRGSGNVSSITRTSAGICIVNFTTALVDTNYSFVGTTRASATVYIFLTAQQTQAKTTSALTVSTVSNAGALTESEEVNIAIFR